MEGLFKDIKKREDALNSNNKRNKHIMIEDEEEEENEDHWAHNFEVNDEKRKENAKGGSEKLQEKIRDFQITVRKLAAHGKNSTLFNPSYLRTQDSGVLASTLKMPKIEKFDGSSCSITHVESFHWAMRLKRASKKAMVDCFPQTLSGPAKTWYMKLQLEKREN